MKKFQFSLAAALKLRDNQFQVERGKLQQLFGEEQNIKHAVKKLAEDRLEASAFVHGSSSINAADLRALATFSLGADARALRLQEQLTRQAKLIGEQRIRVMQAERKVKLLGKLREKRFALWAQEANREIEVAAQESWLSKRHFETSRKDAEGNLTQLKAHDR